MIVLLGKNGSGKTYIAKKLKESGYNYTPNYTTRPKRIGEIDGIDYIYIDEKQFIKMIKDGFFVEYKQFSDFYYGTPISKLSKDAITIGGNIDLLSASSVNPLDILYIHTDIDIRYKGISRRNEAKSVLFNRMHAENFEYLDEFNGYFVDNSSYQGDEVIKRLVNIDGSINGVQPINNFQFFNSLKYVFDESDSQLLTFLKFEEQLLIKIRKQSDKLSGDEIYDLYKSMLMNFSKTYNIGISFSTKDNLRIACDGEVFEGKYLGKKLKSGANI